MMDKQQDADPNNSLKGSFWFVLGVGAFILLSWIAIFIIYIKQT